MKLDRKGGIEPTAPILLLMFARLQLPEIFFPRLELNDFEFF